MKEVKNLLHYAIKNNMRLQEEGETPIAIGLEATPGIGKTSIVEQIAKELNMGYTKIMLSEMEEAGDLIGFPIKEYECQVARQIKAEDGTMKMQVMPHTIWLNDKQIDAPAKGVMYRQTGKTRMGYAKPAWVPEYNENGNIVCLDDFSRANQQLLQATMTLILEQKYTSWSFPKKTTIVLTSNSDDGTNNVQALDFAQQTRFLNYIVGFDLQSWEEWAEKAKIDGRCINFVDSYYKELFNFDDQGNAICNPRSFVMFTKMIKGVDNWDSSESLSFINLIAKGCFKDAGDKFAAMFSAFLRNKMHLLIQPKNMLLDKWDEVKEKLEKTLYDEDGHYRPDIASLLERRFCNYVSVWLDSKEETPISKLKDRIIDFMDNEENGGKKIFNPDLYYHMLSTITADHKKQTNKLLYEPRLARILSN